VGTKGWGCCSCGGRASARHSRPIRASSAWILDTFHSASPPSAKPRARRSPSGLQASDQVVSRGNENTRDPVWELHRVGSALANHRPSGRLLRDRWSRRVQPVLRAGRCPGRLTPCPCCLRVRFAGVERQGRVERNLRAEAHARFAGDRPWKPSSRTKGVGQSEPSGRHRQQDFTKRLKLTGPPSRAAFQRRRRMLRPIAPLALVCVLALAPGGRREEPLWTSTNR
jgi:hypothetical protein